MARHLILLCWLLLSALLVQETTAFRKEFVVEAHLEAVKSHVAENVNVEAATHRSPAPERRRARLAAGAIVVFSLLGVACWSFGGSNQSSPWSPTLSEPHVQVSVINQSPPLNPTLSYYSLMAVFLTVGTANVLLKDFMVQPVSAVYVHGLAFTNFHHPLLWNCITFLGMSICMPIHRLSRRDASDTVEPSVPRRVLLVAVALHWAALFLVNVAYGSVEGSCLQVLRASKLVFTSGLLAVVFGEPQRAHQWMGVAVASVGVVIVSKSIAAHTSLGATTGVMGQVLFSEFLRSILYVYQSKVMKQYNIPALYLTGMMGLIGSAFSLAAIVFAAGMNQWTLPLVVYHQLRQSGSLCLTVGAFLVVVGLFELTGITIGGRSPVTRAMLELCRPGFCWAVELSLGWDSFTVVRAVGYAVLTAGTLVYDGSLGDTTKSALSKGKGRLLISHDTGASAPNAVPSPMSAQS